MEKDLIKQKLGNVIQKLKETPPSRSAHTSCNPIGIHTEPYRDAHSHPHTHEDLETHHC